MVVMVIGLGSMGKRRIRLMKKAFPSIVICGVDSQEARRHEAIKLGAEYVFVNMDTAIREMDIEVAFVCTAPLSHKNIIKQLIDCNIHTFTELNLISDGYEEIIERENKKTIVFLSSTLLYRKDIQYICNKIQGKTVNYIYHSGQYLPDWHPWESYKNFFVGDKRTNGCREIFAIELPWLLKAFGNISKIQVHKSKMSLLEVDYNDNYMVVLQHENGTKGVIFIDIIARKPIRKLEVFSEEVHLFWEGTPHTLQEYDIQSKVLNNINTYEEIDKNEDYCENIIENAYMDEIITFFEAINNGNEALKYSFVDDLKTLEWIDKIEGE